MALRALLVLFLLGLASTHAQAAPAAPLPEPLREWQAWVLHGEEYRDCPFYAKTQASSEGDFACALPGPAHIEIAQGRATIAVDMRMYAPGYVPLIAADKVWPEALTVDGSSAAILPGPSGVRTWLETGAHQLRYQLDLASAPDALYVPESIRLLSLNIDGRSVFPLAREGGSLWLERKVAATETDALETTVHRLWRDGIPQHLITRIRLHVAGKAREIRLGPSWPDSFELVAVSGDLPAVIEAGRVLRVQATAGSYTLEIDARAREINQSLAIEFPASNWPDQEVWSFAADHRLRVVDVSGDAPIDPAQGDVPSDWREYPAFAMATGEALSLAERSRGLGDDANRLTLARELWLDFDGSAYTVQDRIGGRMRQGFRLDLAAPYKLLAASERGESLLVTSGAQPDLRGIEVRYPTLNVETTARLASTTTLPAHGWSERLDTLQASLHLPPGYRLLYAGGVDRAPQAWIERWDIYAVFIAAFAVVLAWRLGGLPLAGAVAVLVVLGMHEEETPRYSLIALLLLMLAWRALPLSRLKHFVAALAVIAGLSLAWVALPFAISQARYALHPQLADGASPSNWLDMGVLGGNAADKPMAEPVVQEQSFEPPAPPAPPAPAAAAPMEADQMQRSMNYEPQQQALNAPSNLRSKRSSNLERYAKDAVVQAGIGRPTWRWMAVDLGFDGPVDSGQPMSLWLAPPWLTALWRLLLVAALAAIAWVLVRQFRRPPAFGAIGAALLLLGTGGSAGAAELPDSDWLQSLHDRLTEAPKCVPLCARLAQANVSIVGDRLQVDADVHAAEQLLLPLPIDDAALSDVSISVDATPVAVLGRAGDPRGAWVVVPRGVHRITLAARVRGDRVALDFSEAPGRVQTDLPGWTVTGLRDGRLLSERLELVREAPTADAASGAPARVPVTPFVRVEREISLDLDWTVTTRIVRIAPAEGGFSVRIPLLPGEQPTDGGLKVDEGRAEITLQPGIYEATINSRLPRSETLVLTAPELAGRAEVWRVLVGPSLSMQASGVPVSAPIDGIGEDVWMHEFNPLPGEKLTLTISRPAAVPGATLVADAVSLTSDFGARSTTHTLSLQLRATQGGSHALRLPEGAELLNVSINGSALSLKPDKGVLTLPIRPGAQQLELSWRADAGVSTVVATPAIDLGLDAANISLRMRLPDDRWILRLAGPAVGPAVLYWSGLIVLLAIGYGLGRSGRALLPQSTWMLLVLGFSTFSYIPLFIVATGFLALDARRRYLPGRLGPWRFDAIQIVLTGITLLSFLALVAAIPAGLLGSPDMHIAGGDASYGELGWLADRATGLLPQASAITLPMWAYKAAMLAFALWLAYAFIGWIKLAWAALTAGGGWMRLRRVKAP